MKAKTAQILMVQVLINCPFPLCSEQYRNRYNLQIHLTKEHTQFEAEELLSSAVEYIL